MNIDELKTHRFNNFSKESENLFKLLNYNTRLTKMFIPKSRLITSIIDIFSNKKLQNLFQEFLLLQGQNKILDFFIELNEVLDSFLTSNEIDKDNNQSDVKLNKIHSELISENKSESNIDNETNVITEVNGTDDLSISIFTIATSDDVDKLLSDSENDESVNICQADKPIKVCQTKMQPFVDKYFNNEFFFSETSPATDLEQMIVRYKFSCAIDESMLIEIFIFLKNITERTLQIKIIPKFFASTIFNKYYTKEIFGNSVTSIQSQSHNETVHQNQYTTEGTTLCEQISYDNFEFYSDLSIYQTESDTDSKSIKKASNSNKKNEANEKAKRNSQTKSNESGDKSTNIEIKESDDKQGNNPKSDKTIKSLTAQDGEYTDAPIGLNADGRPRTWNELYSQQAMDRQLAITVVNSKDLHTLLQLQQKETNLKNKDKDKRRTKSSSMKRTSK